MMVARLVWASRPVRLAQASSERHHLGQVLVPVLEQLSGGFRQGLRPRSRSALRVRRVPQWRMVELPPDGGPGIVPSRRPGAERPFGEDAQRDDGGDPAAEEHSVQPPVAVGGYCGIVGVALAAALPVDAVQECIDHDVARRDARSGEQPLDTLACFADQDPSSDRLVRGRVLCRRTRDPERRRPSF